MIMTWMVLWMKTNIYLGLMFLIPMTFLQKILMVISFLMFSKSIKV